MQFTVHGKKGFVSLESLLKKKNGETMIISVTVFPIYDAKGSFMGGVELFRDITAQKKREREHKNILSMFAHDMKNPVVIARGFLARLISEKAGDVTERQREYYGLIEEELKRLHELICDFLQFSRFEAKEYIPVLSPFNITDALLEHVKSAKVEADAKNIKIVCNIPGDDPVTLKADGSMISRVVSNLLDNAIKYTDPGGTIVITIGDRNNYLVVGIQDTGIGIPKEHLPFIFDAFYRVSKDSKGSGLGLFIAKTIVESHGGTIWVESVPSEGSTFSFTLPKKSHEMALLS